MKGDSEKTREQILNELEKLQRRTAELEDIASEYKRSQEALRESEERFKELAELLPQTVFEFDMVGNFIYVNRHGMESTGYTRADLERGVNALELIAPEDREKTAGNLKRLFRGEVIGGNEYTMVRKDGSTFPVIIYSSLIRRNDEPVGMRGVVVDITSRKKAEDERRIFEARMQHTQKLEGLGVLAGGIAHDFNNLLMVILGNTDLAKTVLSSVSPALEYLNDIEISSKRAAELCNQMLAYSGKGRFVIKRISLSDVVRDMTLLLEVSISKSMVLKYNFGDNLPDIQADSTQVRQIIMNLIINASEAIGDQSGMITISTGAMHGDAETMTDNYLDDELPEGPYTYLEVADNGCGMDENTRKKVFDPFFTTKFMGRGLGLSAVLGIVRGHKGAIKLFTEQNRGTTFKVMFPALGGPSVGGGAPECTE
ncbi:nitrogen regulation protein NR(II) [Thermodesulfobacteriota bacterium]